MSLLITQGKQDTSKDNKFEAIETDYVTCKIDKITLDEFRDNSIKVNFKILEGKYKNRVIPQSIQYAATAKLDMTWKYRQLRKAVGQPYQENEPDNIDIEAILLNRALSVKFTKTADKEDKEKFYQNATFKSLNANEVADADDVQAIKPTVYKKETKTKELSNDSAQESPLVSAPEAVEDEWNEGEWS